MSLFYTYVWRDAAGVPFYVGKGTGRRAWDVVKRSREFKAIQSQCGCTVEVVDEFVLESDAHLCEVELIARYGRQEFGGSLLNRTDGGEGASGAVRSASARAAVSAAQKGRPRTPEQRAQMSIDRKGRKATPETRAKMSASQKNRTHTPEARAKIGDAHRGKVISPEMRAKISETNHMKGPLKGKYKGVTVLKSGKFRSTIYLDGKRKYMGEFRDEESAARAYDVEAAAAWGNCYLNFPPAANDNIPTEQRRSAA